MYIRSLSVLLLSIFIAVTTACTHVQRAASDKDTEAKTFVVTKGKSNIYIYRNETENFNTTMDVDIDGNHVGATEQSTFILHRVDPGEHVIKAHGENVSELKLTTEANKNYFVWLEVKVGAFIPRAKLHSVDQMKGESGVNECKLVK